MASHILQFKYMTLSVLSSVSIGKSGMLRLSGLVRAQSVCNMVPALPEWCSLTAL